MLTHVTISNYRALRNLTISKLARLNLIAGNNNSGKTSLLEALFLWSGAGNPEIAMNHNIMRGADQIGTSTPQSYIDSFWKPFFSELNVGSPILIEVQHASRGKFTLSVSLERPNAVELPLQTNVKERSLESLYLRFGNSGKAIFEGTIHLKRDTMQVEQSGDLEILIPATIILARARTNEGDALRLAEVRRQKQGDVIVEAAQLLDPRIVSVDDSIVGSTPSIWIDIGLDEMVPLVASGDGLCRLVGFMLAIVSTPGGLVLIDEIENGLHHSMLRQVWMAIGRIAERFDVQIFATTHSMECVQAAQGALDPNSFLLHRLENNGGDGRCVSYEPEELTAALAHEFEVR